MLSQSKKFSKMENYWIKDFKFRKMLQNWEELFFMKNSYSDLNCADLEFYEFKQGLIDREFEPPPAYNSYFELRKINYEFGWKLGLSGKISSLLKQENWIKFKSRKEAEVIRNKVKIDFNFPLGYFFEGLEGNLYSKFSLSLSKDHILANLAGYDFFLQRKEKGNLNVAI